MVLLKQVLYLWVFDIKKFNFKKEFFSSQRMIVIKRDHIFIDLSYDGLGDSSLW